MEGKLILFMDRNDMSLLVHYYTEDHEWIVFDKYEAYVGVSLFKLTGIKFIEKIIYMKLEGFCRKGELIAVVVAGDYEIGIHMPVDGHVVESNKKLLGDPSLIYNQSAEPGWIAKIYPLTPGNIDELISSEEYFTRTYRKAPYA